ncbi:MAG TPA: hypothetical protein VEM96_05340 [Pyrinomonadaceae bacterium]|nr:hypothetical protein [Pyrinomonadaceae bacterium]
MDLINSSLYGNTTAVSASGQGSDGSQVNNVNAVTEVRIYGGSIVANGTAFFQTNPGVGFANIFMQTTNGAQTAYTTFMGGNTTFFAGTGTGCGPCSLPVVFFSGSQLK